MKMLLLSVCVLLLSALTVSAVSVSVSPDLQQVFSGSSPVSLSCVDDGQTVAGWTVRRTRGGLTEDCGAAAGFGRVQGSSCVLDRSVSSGGSYFCEDSSGQQSPEVSISVSDKGVILEIPALPVRTGSDVTLRCRERSGDTAAYFSFNGSRVGSESNSEHVITNVQQSHEGLYSCATHIFGESFQSFLRVRDPPPPTQRTTDSTPSSSTTSPPLSVPRLVCHLLAVCLYCICTVLLVLILCSRKSAANAGKHPAISTETAQRFEGPDDVTADVTTEHDF